MPPFMPIDENLELSTSNRFLRDRDSAFGGRSYYRMERAASEAPEAETAPARTGRRPRASAAAPGRRIRSHSASTRPPFETAGFLGSSRAELNCGDEVANLGQHFKSK